MSVVLKLFLNDLMNLELYVVFISGFVIVVGIVIVVYIEFGVSFFYEGIYIWFIVGII